MKMRFMLVVLVLSLCLAGSNVIAGESGKKTKMTSAVRPKPLSGNVKNGLDWLVSHQGKDGGWGQGEESAAMGHGLDNLKDMPNVADTCVSTLALLRSGSAPDRGEHAGNIQKAIGFICSEIEKSNDKDLYITEVRGTRVQSKLGPYIDTFLAALLLAEVKGHMPDQKSEERASKALRKTISKIEKNQRKDGTWDDSGWAPAISQGMAGKALNRAAQSGVAVNDDVRVKTETYARSQFDKKTGAFSITGSAGVPLYSSASNLGNMQESYNTNQMKLEETKEKMKKTKDEEEKKKLRGELDRYEQNEKDLNDARDAVIRKLDDKSFIQGFGSNGGEEFLSYLSIGESLVAQGGKEWQKWDASITENLNHIQNKDGSWTGHHCITGRNFCTAAALLVLLVDRTPIPVAAKIKK